MMFKATSFISQDKQTWSDLWVDSTYANDDDGNNIPDSVYKSSSANKWNDNSNITKVCFLAWAGLSYVVGVACFRGVIARPWLYVSE